MREKSAGFLRSDRASTKQQPPLEQKKTEEEGRGGSRKSRTVRNGGGCFTAIFLEERCYKRELFAVYVERSSSSSSSFGFPFGREPWKSSSRSRGRACYFMAKDGVEKRRSTLRTYRCLFIWKRIFRRGGVASLRGFRHDFRFFFMGSRLWMWVLGVDMICLSMRELV